MAGREMTQLGQRALSLSLASLGNVLSLIIYLVLVPILVFFMLKDRDRLVGFTMSLLPQRRELMTRIWHEMDDQIANYVRGKFIEIIIVGSVAFFTFICFGLPYSALLAVLVGLSVLVLHRGGLGHAPGGGGGWLSLRYQRPVSLCTDRLRRHPGAGWQRPGACAVLRSRQSASGIDHPGGAVLRRHLGFWGYSSPSRWPPCSRHWSMPGREASSSDARKCRRGPSARPAKARGVSALGRYRCPPTGPAAGRRRGGESFAGVQCLCGLQDVGHVPLDLDPAPFPGELAVGVDQEGAALDARCSLP